MLCIIFNAYNIFAIFYTKILILNYKILIAQD